MYTPHTLALLARAPTPGRSKTRLIPRLGPEGASSFAQAALTDLLHLSSRIPSCRHILFYTPTSSGSGLRDLLEREGLNGAWELHPQPETGDLGGRLGAALEHVQQTGEVEAGTVTFIGMDCFDLTPDSVLASMKTVSESNGKACMIPALDGGYVLLTLPLKCKSDAIFSGIEWSTSKTGQMQSQRLADAGLVCELAEALPDVDEPEDLERLWRGRESKERDFPRTMTFLDGVMPRQG